MNSISKQSPEEEVDLSEEELEEDYLNEDEIVEKVKYLVDETDYFDEGHRIEVINVFMFYMNNRKIENYKKFEYSLKMNKMPKDDLLSLLLKNKHIHGNKYGIQGIYKYNFNVKKDQISNFIVDTQEYDMVEHIKSMREITFEPSINIYQNHNALFIFFNNETNKKTKKRVHFTDHVEVSSKGKTMKKKMSS